MVPLNIQTTIDNELATPISDLALKQPNHLATKSRCWQGPRTHTTPPADGILAAPNNLAAKATDLTDSWLTMAIALPALTAAAYTVHAYSTPAGQGYVIHAEVIISGVYHRKSVNVGPAAWLTRTWRTTKVIKMS